MKRTPITRATKALARTSTLTATRLAPVSDQRKAENGADGEWAALKALVDERDGGVCQVAAVWPEVDCGGRIDPHHTEPTGAGFPRLCAPERLICCCRNHHQALHTETRLARERGVLR